MQRPSQNHQKKKKRKNVEKENAGLLADGMMMVRDIYNSTVLGTANFSEKHIFRLCVGLRLFDLGLVKGLRAMRSALRAAAGSHLISGRSGVTLQMLQQFFLESVMQGVEDRTSVWDSLKEI